MEDDVKTFSEEYPDIHGAVKKMIELKVREEIPPPKPPTGPDPMAAFHHALDRDVPDWRQINTSREFMDFLNAPDPSSPGMTKLQSIKMAYDARDAMSTVRHFEAFKAAKARGAAEKIDREGIKKFYDDARKGVYGDINGEKYRVEEARMLQKLKGKRPS